MSKSATRTPPAPSGSIDRRLAVLAGVAVLSMLPPYVGPPFGLELNVSSTVEVVDHVLPGLVALTAAGVALWLVRRGQADSTAAFAVVASCALAGLFQTVSHLSLVFNIGEAGHPAGAVILHATPCFALLAVSLWLLLAPQPVAPRG